ncbi:MAG: helix-turn-helix domain-containing protein, partial [Verrucomicrobiae bacterium]|nr:helix-turn-helix domain-containing protein [Verrucomicrobiae bacterium]
MANEIPMTTREAIKALQMRGYSKRKIARELGIHRNTV